MTRRSLFVMVAAVVCGAWSEQARDVADFNRAVRSYNAVSGTIIDELHVWTTPPPWARSGEMIVSSRQQRLILRVLR
jgi:hypothetical protein